VPSDPIPTPIVYSTSPPFGLDMAGYADRVAETARWSEAGGCRGTLVYTDNSILDPWLVSQIVLRSTERLRPLVAVQPVYLHPYSVAKMITSLNRLCGRAVDLNWVAGGFTQDLEALDDSTPHDRRYDRLVEYGRIVLGLLAGEGPLTHEGEFHTVRNLRLNPPLPPEEMPYVTVSGSSEAGLAAARALGALAVQYPDPRLERTPLPQPSGVDLGIRVGMIAREDEDEAWAVAHARFPPDRKGQLVHRLAMATSDSVWHRQLSEAGAEARPDTPFWMVPFENYKTFCPYLVGAYERIATAIAFYLRAGYRTFILDVPFEERDPADARRVVELAIAMAADEPVAAPTAGAAAKGPR
jgi:alkanesulfonate monooxygenase